MTDRSDTKETFYKVPVWGLSTAERDVAERRHGVQEIKVPSITLDDLLERNGVREIDLLSIDVEGHHEAVLRGFDLARWRPKLVCIEEEGAFAVPWFRARGYEPIRRYRLRDGVNWYFAPRAAAAAADARRNERDEEALRERRATLANEPPDSPLRVYLSPKYVLDGDGSLVLNEEWVVASEATKAQPSADRPHDSTGSESGERPAE